MMAGAGPGKKRQRINTTAKHQFHRHSSPVSATNDNTSFPDKPPLRRSASSSSFSFSVAVSTSKIPIVAGGFNDSVTGDVILRLYMESISTTLEVSDFPDSSVFANVEDVQIYLHSNVLRRAKYFDAWLSDRWQSKDTALNSDESDGSGKDKPIRLNFCVSESTGSISSHLTVLQLLYSYDFSSVIVSPAIALSILPVALEFLFEDCVKSCVVFLEAVPWSEDEEKVVLCLVPFLREEESRELLARVSPMKNDITEEMLHGLILSAIHNYPNMAFVKAFVAKLLREFSSRDSARRVLERAFDSNLKVVKESLEDYSSPDFRGDHDETEAMQGVHLQTAMRNGRHLLWLIERMIELKVADTAVKEWSEQISFTADLQRAFREDAWRNIVPGLPTVFLRCTSKLVNAVAAGTILAAREVRIKLVKEWLPVLVVCKENATPMLAHKSLYVELEETFLQIISTLPMYEAQELLKQCLSFSTRNVEDCPHLIMAFNTWFRRATRLPPVEEPT